MNDIDIVAVCSRSFSNNKTLRGELLEKYKNVIFNDTGKQMFGKDLIEFLSGATKAIVALEKFTPDIISQLKSVRVLAKYGVGLDMIDMNALQRSEIRLGWQSGVNKRSVAELVIAFMIMLLRKSVQLNNKIKLTGQWKPVIGESLTDKKIGIIGCGNIGKDLVSLLMPFNCKIFAYDIVDYSDFYHKNHITKSTLEELLSICDIVTIHTPLTSSTKHLINESNLNLMSSNSILINTARGGIVDEIALANKLATNENFMAGFDVLEIEPPENMGGLMHYENFVCTPHIGGSTSDSVLKMGRSAIECLDSHFIL